MEIISKRSVFGDNKILSSSHLKKIEDYINKLESKNMSLENQVQDQEVELGILTNKSLEEKHSKDYLQDELQKLKFKLNHIKNTFPEAQNFSQAYDMLVNYKRSLLMLSSGKKEYHFSYDDIEILARYGRSIAESFIRDEVANIPMKNGKAKAKIKFCESYSTHVSDELGIKYFDYYVVVVVVNQITFESEQMSLKNFSDRYKNEIAIKELSNTTHVMDH